MDGKVVVLSDIHFGVDDCSIGTYVQDNELTEPQLTKRRDAVSLFCNYIRETNIKYLILLGDVFDLQLSTIGGAVKASEDFFI